MRFLGPLNSIGWSFAWVRFSRIRRFLWISRAACATTSIKSAGLTWYEQEQVTRIPPGRSIFRARRLSSLYPRRAVSRLLLLLAKAGGSRTIVSYCCPASGVVAEQVEGVGLDPFDFAAVQGWRCGRLPRAPAASYPLRSLWNSAGPGAERILRGNKRRPALRRAHTEQPRRSFRADPETPRSSGLPGPHGGSEPHSWRTPCSSFRLAAGWRSGQAAAPIRGLGDRRVRRLRPV